MELLYFKTVKECPYAPTVYDLLVMADKEFIPPLSSRGSTTQAELSGVRVSQAGIQDYYDTMSLQPVIVAVEDGRCLGFMAFKTDHTCSEIGPETLPNLYASTCVVHPDGRGKGLMRGFYREMLRLYPHCPLFTRTWHTNASHLRVLDTLGFREIARLPDHRGPGMDTVYFRREALNTLPL
jgi:L-amino acid N-acyltransferase YncA